MRPERLTIAVVVPAYRASQTLIRALESIRCQTLAPDEVWVVDDASPDDTVALASRFIADHRLDHWRIVMQSVNAGPGVARDAAVRRSGCEVVAFLDADDEWAPHHLHSAQEWMGGLQLDLFGAAFGTPEQARQGVSTQPPVLVRPGALLLRNPFRTSTVVIRRQAYLQAGGFEPGIRYSEDYRLWLRLCLGLRGAAAVSADIHASYAVQGSAVGPRLTHRLWSMEQAELANFALLRRQRWISLPQCALAMTVSLLKFTRRVAAAAWRCLRERN